MRNDETNLVRFIGDVHGKFGRYKTILKEATAQGIPTIQVGDMGIGFFSPYGIPSENPPYDRMVEGNHRFIRGNHDNPAVCRRHSQYIPDLHLENNVMFVGGALSIDRAFRNVNESWWEDEELSVNELNDAYDLYAQVKPRVMITHEFPEVITDHMFNKGKIDDPSRTRQAFQSMWEQHKPEMWLAGHWHQHRDINIMGTRFICLAELQIADIDLETLEVAYLQ